MTPSGKLCDVKLPLHYIANYPSSVPILFQSDIGLTVFAFTSYEDAELYANRERLACGIVTISTWDEMLDFCTNMKYETQRFHCIEIDPIDCKTPGIAKFLRTDIIDDLQSGT